MKWGVASGERIVASESTGKERTLVRRGSPDFVRRGSPDFVRRLVRCGSPDHAVRVLVRRGSPDHAVRRLRSARVSCIGMVNVVPTYLT